MENQNHHLPHKNTDIKPGQKPNQSYKRNQANGGIPNKKTAAQKKHESKLMKMFESLSYQELDAD